MHIYFILLFLHEPEMSEPLNAPLFFKVRLQSLSVADVKLFLHAVY